MLFHSALRRTLLANPDARIPFYRNATVVPAGSITMRASGSALLVVGAVVLSSDEWYWPFVIVFIGPVIALGAIQIHNRNVQRRADTGAAAGSDDSPDSEVFTLRRPLITTFDGWSWIPTSWGALVIIAAVAVVTGVVLSWLT